MTNKEIVEWHRDAAKRLRAEGKDRFATDHNEIADYFQSHPELDDSHPDVDGS